MTDRWHHNLRVVPQTGEFQRQRQEAARLERAAARAERDIVRHSSGWRRMRLLKRARLGTTLVASRTAAGALRGMFGWDAER